MTVALVGAGPGDPDLLTVKAARLLSAADVVVHDALVGDGVLDLVDPSAELIDVGKRPGRPVPQEMISALLVELGRQGRQVVRLKGGDPFVFGRGGEEALALRAAGIAVDVVPGITSSVAAPAAAGIPVTHRGVSAACTVVTGHRAAAQEPVAWESVAGVGGTIVVLMGSHGGRRSPPACWRAVSPRRPRSQRSVPQRPATRRPSGADWTNSARPTSSRRPSS